MTLNGEAVDASQLRTLGSNEFLVQLNGLDVAKHELDYTATDELGNSVSGTVKFEVKPRPSYKVTLRPGWNLISLPGTPVDPAIGTVINDDLSVRLVLGVPERRMADGDPRWRKLEWHTDGHHRRLGLLGPVHRVRDHLGADS